MKRLIFPTILTLASASPAFAHLGHVGEVAGHAHWLAVGAIVVAGTLAALLASAKKPDDEKAEETVADEQGVDGEGETA